MVSTPALQSGVRWSLFLATLLYVVGAVAGSVAHLHAGEEAVAICAETGQGGSDSAPRAPAPHDELGCFLCQALGAAEVGATSSSGEAVATAGLAPTGDTGAPAMHDHSSPPQARAPPAA